MAFKDFVKTVKSEAGDAVEVTKLKAKISKEKANIKETYEAIGEIFYNTAHPYTKGLMQSIAKLDTAKGEKLKPIEGTPPDLFAPPKGCPFAARCEYCMDVCEQLPPEAYTVAEDHTTFCWLQHEMAPETDLKKATAKKGEV